MHKKLIAFFILIVFSSSLIFAASSTDSSSNSTTSNTPNAEPYNKDNIPDWAKYLRRFEIVTLGSLPFTTILATTGYTVVRYCMYGFDSNYIPNPLAFTSDAANINFEEQKIVLYSALATSLAVGIIDISIYVTRKEKAKKMNQSILPDNITVEDKIIIQENPEDGVKQLSPEEEKKILDDYEKSLKDNKGPSDGTLLKLPLNGNADESN